MNVGNQVMKALLSMFGGDIRLSFGILAAVALAAVTVHTATAMPRLGGAVLLFACLGLLAAAILRTARRPADRR